MENLYDICVIGGGINGCGIAAEASRRGLKTILFEQNDFASATSSASSKLIHGGLRYLEYYEFRLVYEALKEREVLLKIAPHLIHPLKFILPYSKSLRPFWLLRLGIWLYDHLYWKNSLPKGQTILFKKNSLGEELHSSFIKGLSYYDCFAEDIRLVLENLLAAKESGADIYNYCKVIKIEKMPDYWKIVTKSRYESLTQVYYSKALVNATGPWLLNIIEKNLLPSGAKTTLVKGSHLVFKKFYEGSHAYILQTYDKRVVFTIPYYKDYLLVGTTDIPITFSELPFLKVEQSEKEYLCNVLNHYFFKNIKPEDSIFEYWGVRSLLAEEGESATSTTRDYKLNLEYTTSQTPLLHIFGGKITTFRALSEHAIDLFSPWFKNLKPKKILKPLPGGIFVNISPADFLQKLKLDYPFLQASLLERFFKIYGSRTSLLLNSVKSIEDMGEWVGDLIFEREINFLVEYEWVKTAEDLLMRRTRLGIFASTKQKEEVLNYFNKKYKSFNLN